MQGKEVHLFPVVIREYHKDTSQNTDKLIEFLKDFCRYHKISKINGEYKKTSKNSLIYEFLKKLNIINDKKFSFVLLSKKNNVNLPKIKVTKPSLRKR